MGHIGSFRSRSVFFSEGDADLIDELFWTSKGYIAVIGCKRGWVPQSPDIEGHKKIIKSPPN